MEAAATMCTIGLNEERWKEFVKIIYNKRENERI